VGTARKPFSGEKQVLPIHPSTHLSEASGTKNIKCCAGLMAIFWDSLTHYRASLKKEVKLKGLVCFRALYEFLNLKELRVSGG